MKKSTSTQLTLLVITIFICINSSKIQASTNDQRVDSVLKLMTIEEKIGQMTQYASFWSTGPVSPESDKLKDISDGRVGSLLNVVGTEKVRAMQEIAMKSRLKIPLIFGLDVIHGYKTTFPIPLAEAASWDMKMIEASERIAATEAAAGGINWTFAPMVDIARDPRWGRVMEGAGEDPYLGSQVARARVKGFIGNGLGNKDAIMCTAKHFAAYGAGIGGRDYNTADMSEQTLREVYLPPFKSAVDAGVSTIMNSLHELNGIPTTGNKLLVRKILKGEWDFQGFVISDWGSIAEMVEHGYATDTLEAAKMALEAGSDMDMECRSYRNKLPILLQQGKVDIKLVDEAVRRILTKKMELGLFENPYKFCDSEREKSVLNNSKHREIARDMAKRCIVLLKNENKFLPLKSSQKIALIGPLAKATKDNLASWSVMKFDNEPVVSIYDGIKQRIGEDKLLYAKGCGVTDTSKNDFKEAVAIASKADIVLLCMGENRDMSGEAFSKSDISLPGVQEELIRKIIILGKPVVVLLSAGRPMVFDWTADHASTIMYTWWLGSEAGNAIADVLFGDYNPSAKLPITFPRNVGQIPIYYNCHNTGRPAMGDDNSANYKSGYIDLPKSAKFPFGYGLSYTQFSYSDLKISGTNLSIAPIEITCTITNIGSVTGEEIAQLYIRDKTASMIRPVKELKDFVKVTLKPNESKEVKFLIDKEKLSFYDNEMHFIFEPGWFYIMVGASSADIKLNTKMELK
jgi:beta-glucosidase